MVWFLILGPLTVFIFGALLDGILIGEWETPTDAIAEMTAEQGLKGVFTILGSLGFVFAFIGTVLLCDSMQGDDKPGGVLARIGMILFIALTALAIAASMTDCVVRSHWCRYYRDHRRCKMGWTCCDNTGRRRCIMGGFVLLFGYRLHFRGCRTRYAKEIAPCRRLDFCHFRWFLS